jgi:AbrB family looped-hinge helix DNA binding protein
MRQSGGSEEADPPLLFCERLRCRDFSRAKTHLPDIQNVGYSDTVGALASRVGRRGTVVLPAKLRRRLGIEEGSFVVAEERENGILIRPAAVVPVEIYTPERRAEFLLNNAVTIDDYRRARAAVKRMALDPDRIKHHRPSKRRG